MLAAKEELKSDSEMYAEAKLRAAELLASTGDLDEATRLRRDVAGSFGRSPQALLLRRRAASALAE